MPSSPATVRATFPGPFPTDDSDSTRFAPQGLKDSHCEPREPHRKFRNCSEMEPLWALPSP
jgi:hypothetical protein